MGFQLLIRAIDNSHADPEKDRRGCYKKGYPVVVFPLTHTWGAEEGLPGFVILRCEDETITPERVQNWLDQWKDDFDYEVLSANAVQGKYTVRVFEKNVSTSGANALTQEKVESWLLKWGCDNISVSANSVQFDFALWDAVRSFGFWEVPLTDVDFSLNGYDSGTGIGDITITILNPQIKIKSVEHKITERGGTVVSSTEDTVRFTIKRSVILTKFREALKRAAERVYCRRQFYFTASQVDQVIAAGGTITLTKAQIMNAVKNKLTE